jgi:two-component system LytT family response regulator
MVTVLVVDDEELAREGVRTLVDSEPGFEVVGVCGNARDVLSFLACRRVDVMLLDVQMPGMSGLDLLERIPPAQVPVVVFITAHDRHAVKAFETHAIDYVLKPFSDVRLKRALARARREVMSERLGLASDTLAAIVAAFRGEARSSEETIPPAFLRQLTARSGGRTTYLPVQDIIWVSSADYYSEIHVAPSRSLLVRETMKRLEQQLDPQVFVRVHRTVIVNVDHVREVATHPEHGSRVVLKNGTTLPLGRLRKAALNRALAERFGGRN